MPFPTLLPTGSSSLGRGAKSVGALSVGVGPGGGTVGEPAPTVIRRIQSGTKVIDIGSVTNAQTLEVSVTIAGVGLGDLVQMIPPATIEAGILVGAAYVSAANTVKFRVGNLTAAPIDPASATWGYLWVKLS